MSNKNVYYFLLKEFLEMKISKPRDNSASNKFHHQFKCHFLLFFLFGQSIWLPNCIPCKRIVSLIPSIFSIFSIIYCSIGLALKKYETFFNTHVLFVQLQMLVNMLPGIFGAVQCIRLARKARHFNAPLKILSFDKIIETLEKQTPIKVPWNCFQTRFTRKSKIIVVFYSLMFILKFLLRPLNGQSLRIKSAFSMLYRTATVYHTVFYVDLFNLLSSSVNDSVKAHRQVLLEKNTIEVNDYIDVLYLIKIQHLQLWHCRQIIIKHFGYVIIVTMIDSTYTITASAFWAYHYLMSGFDWIAVTRKYYENLV